MTRVAVIGAGYVGLVTGACLAKIGHQVICVDRDSERIEQIRRGTVPFHEPGLDALLAEVLGSGLFSASTDLAPAVGQSGVSMIAVGTPSTNGVIDLGAVQASCREIGEALGPRGDYHVVVVKSTVVPGTTDTVVAAEVMGASGRSEDSLGICMNPEFLREGSAVEDVMHPDRIVIGARSSRAHDVVAGLYRSFDCPVLATNPGNAEMIKYTSNVLLATLISFSNEIASVCESRPELDETTVMNGVHLDRRLTPIGGAGATAPGVLSYLRAGIGYGGSCLPKDLAALRSHAEASGVETPLLDAVAEVNAVRPARIVDMLAQMLGGLQDKVVTVLGLAFKPHTDDVRCSPSFALIDGLRDGGANVRAHDPQALAGAAPRLDGNAAMCGDPVLALRGADAAIIATAWPEYRELPWPEICSAMRTPIILDGRGFLSALKWPDDVVYQRIGRAANGEFGSS